MKTICPTNQLDNRSFCDVDASELQEVDGGFIWFYVGLGMGVGIGMGVGAGTVYAANEYSKSSSTDLDGMCY